MQCNADGTADVKDATIDADAHFDPISVGTDKIVWYNPDRKRYLHLQTNGVIKCDAKTTDQATVWTSPYSYIYPVRASNKLALIAPFKTKLTAAGA